MIFISIAKIVITILGVGLIAFLVYDMIKMIIKNREILKDTSTDAKYDEIQNVIDRYYDGNEEEEDYSDEEFE